MGSFSIIALGLSSGRGDALMVRSCFYIVFLWVFFLRLA